MKPAKKQEAIAMSEDLICWPCWMPVPLRSGYGYEPVDRTLKTEMEIGSIKRVEFDTDETTISCTCIMTNHLQIQFFEKLVRDCLRQGTRWFIMPLQIAGIIEDYTVRFREQPKFGSLRGSRYTTVTMQLEIEKRNLLDDDVMDVLILFGPTKLLDIDKKLDKLIKSLSGITQLPLDLLGDAA
jgi:hypothetical protein